MLNAVILLSMSTHLFHILSGKKERLFKIFEGQCDNVIDLIVATNEEAVLQCDIYGRTPRIHLGKGLCYVKDSVYAMQPNMGQEGRMAVEDIYQLAMELDRAWKQSIESGTAIDVVSALKSY